MVVAVGGGGGIGGGGVEEEEEEKCSEIRFIYFVEVPPCKNMQKYLLSLLH